MNPKHNRHNSNSTKNRSFGKRSHLSGSSRDQFLEKIYAPLKEMDTKLFNDLSSGVSKIIEDLSKEMNELDENEQNSDGFQQLEKIKQDLIKCIHPDK